MSGAAFPPEAAEVAPHVPVLLNEVIAALDPQPGDVIVSGTPSGVGFARKPPIWMKPGDTCEVEVEQVGLLSNPIIAES